MKIPGNILLIAVLVFGIGVLLYKLLTIQVPVPVTVDLGKQERDSLRIDARARAQEAAKWEAKADSARGWHDRELATALPVETLYMQAHAEALSLPVAAKWAFMGQLPDTGITR